jgi:hypothetical protein
MAWKHSIADFWNDIRLNIVQRHSGPTPRAALAITRRLLADDCGAFWFFDAVAGIHSEAF